MSESTHQEQREQLAAYALGALNPTELSEFEHHLAGCAECQVELRWLAPATRRLSGELDQVEPPAGLRQSVLAAVAEDLESTESASPNQIDAESTPGADTDGHRPRRRWFSLAGFGPRPAAAGALSLIVVLVVGGIAGYALNSGGETSETTQPGTQVIASESGDGSDAILTRNEDSGTLRISDLEQPGRGEVYQAWIRRGDRIESTDSLFLPRSDGTANAAIPDLNGVESVMVSIEPKGGSPSPTTTPVVAIELPG